MTWKKCGGSRAFMRNTCRRSYRRENDRASVAGAAASRGSGGQVRLASAQRLRGTAALGEEFPQQHAAFVGQHAADQLRVMIQPFLREQIDDGAAGAGLRIG